MNNATKVTRITILVQSHDNRDFRIRQCSENRNNKQVYEVSMTNRDNLHTDIL